MAAARVAALAWTIVCSAATHASSAPQREQMQRERWMIQMCPRFGALLQEVYGYPRPSSQSQRTVNARSTAVNRALQDELFIPVFGKGFDALTSQEIELLEAAAARCNSDYKRGTIDETYYVLQYQELMLKDVFSTRRFQQNVQQVLKARQSGITLGKFVKEMEKLPVSAQSVQRLGDISRESVDLLAAAPDNANAKVFPADHEKARIRIEIPVEKELVASRVSSSQGYDGLQLLLGTQKELQAKMQSERIATINSSRKELSGLLAQKISFLDAEQAAAESATYQVFASQAKGLAAMVEAKSREMKLEEKYGAQLGAPEFARFNQERRAFRERLIDQNAGAFSNALLAADTMSGIRVLTQEYFVDADLKSAPAAQWMQAVQQRRTQLLMGMRTDGLQYAHDIESIFTGDFDEVRIKNNGLDMTTMVGAYIDAFSANCPASLPENKVQVMESYCSGGYSVTSQVYTSGIYAGSTVPGSESSTCLGYSQRPTGVWADPRMLDLKDHIGLAMLTEGIANPEDVLRKVAKALQDPVGTTVDVLTSVNALNGDMNRLLTLNSCAAPILKRFQTNLIRFGLGQSPVGSAEVSGSENK
jgi:hypothetical protein